MRHIGGELLRIQDTVVVVKLLAVLICCVLEQDTLSALLQSTQFTNEYLIGTSLLGALVHVYELRGENSIDKCLYFCVFFIYFHYETG